MLIFQRRQARKMEQANNPHYLKSSVHKSKSLGEDLSMIPIASLELNVPLKIPGKRRNQTSIYTK